MKVWIVELTDWDVQHAVSGDWTPFDVMVWASDKLGFKSIEDWPESFRLEEFEDNRLVVYTTFGSNIISAIKTKVIE